MDRTVKNATFAIRKEIVNLVEENWTRLLNKSIGKPKSKRILDVGCGDTLFSGYLIKTRNEYYGIDLRITMKASLHNKGISLIQADAAHLPFRDNQFDIALARELLHHVKNPLKVIQEMYRTGERIVIVEANKYAPYMIWAWYEGHKHFSPEEFRNILRKATKTDPILHFVGIYAYRCFSGRHFLFSILSSVSFLNRGKFRDALLGLIFSPTALLADFLFFLTMFSPDFFFTSKLFANRLFGLEMIFNPTKHEG